jgi:hypothetical protein
LPAIPRSWLRPPIRPASLHKHPSSRCADTSGSAASRGSRGGCADCSEPAPSRSSLADRHRRCLRRRRPGKAAGRAGIVWAARWVPPLGRQDIRSRSPRPMPTSRSPLMARNWPSPTGPSSSTRRGGRPRYHIPADDVRAEVPLPSARRATCPLTARRCTDRSRPAAPSTRISCGATRRRFPPLQGSLA